MILKYRRSTRTHPEEVFPEPAYPNDIAIMENTLLEAEELLHRVEKETQPICLLINSSKTKFMHLNPTSGETLNAFDDSVIERVNEFLNVGSYTNTAHDVDSRTGKALEAICSHSQTYGHHHSIDQLR